MRLAFFILGFILGYILGDNIANASPLNIDYLDFEASKFEANRDPYTPNTAPDYYTHRAALNFTMSIFGNLYWAHNLHTETVPGGVKTVGWEWDLGLHLTSYIDLFKHHHSRHVVEEESDVRWKDSSGRFPVEDSYGVRLIFVPTNKPNRLW